MNTLKKICKTKEEHVAHMKTLRPESDLKYMASDMPLTIGFKDHMMMAHGPALIAEVKKASPSKGVIREDFDPVAIAQIYEDAGANCISVLTDEPYFQGHDDFLVNVKESVDIPVIRKDFIIDPYQVYESRVLGADCILLIAAALEDKKLWELYDIAVDLHLDVLVEVHDLEELERTLRLDPMMLGVNNRDLKTLDVSVSTSLDLLMHIPSEVYKISESGIDSHDTLQSLHTAGYQGFLVGESLMREDNIAQAVQNLLKK